MIYEQIIDAKGHSFRVFEFPEFGGIISCTLYLKHFQAYNTFGIEEFKFLSGDTFLMCASLNISRPIII
jgi:hypothetical protein